MSGLDTSTAAPDVVVAALDPGQVRGGLTPEQTADLALRCGRAETQLREASSSAMVARKLLDDARWEVETLEGRVITLEVFLRRAAWGKPWILREAGVKP